MIAKITTVELAGMSLAALDSEQLLEHVFGALQSGRGGWLVTANLDFLRRFAKDPESRADYTAADLRVADGMPLVWASVIKGTPLPGRVAGSSLVLPLCRRAADEGRSVYLLGGEPQANAVAAQKLAAELPGLRLAGASAPFVSARPTEAELAPIARELERARPDIVLVGFGSPKQERVIARLRHLLPGAWWLGVGISFSFLANHVKRAPAIAQRLGLEWMHRLIQEPRRLFRRYVIEDLPFAFVLLGRSALERLRGP